MEDIDKIRMRIQLRKISKQTLLSIRGIGMYALPVLIPFFFPLGTVIHWIIWGISLAVPTAHTLSRQAISVRDLDVDYTPE